MAGSRRPRNVNSRYQRPRDENVDAEEGSSDGRRQRARSSSGSRRGRPPLVRPRDVPEEERRTPDSSDEELVRQSDDEGDEAQQDCEAGGTAGSGSSAAASIYLRGPSKLPGPPLPPLRPVIRPQGDR
jgi:hypothetical protein